MSHCQAMFDEHHEGVARHVTLWCEPCKAKVAILLPVGVLEFTAMCEAFTDLHLDCAPKEKR